MEEKQIINVKVIIVGESGVGKTCIITQLTKKTFKENNIATLGATYLSKKFNFLEFEKYTLKMNIWDTAGQEKYHSLTKIFFHEAKIIIFVYDITDKKTFEKLKSFWLNELENKDSNSVVMGIAGNKSDLFEQEEVNPDEAKNFAQEIGASFSLTSAKGNIGIEELFVDLGMKYLSQTEIYQTNNKEKKNKKIKKINKINKIESENPNPCCL